MAHPGKVETGHKWTTRDVKWDNYIGSMVVMLGIPFDYVTCRDMLVGWIEANEHDSLKCQAIHIGPALEAKKMAVCTNLKSCSLYGEFWLLIKVYDS